MKFIVVETFDWAHRGVDVMTYHAGDTIETEDADLIRVATEEKWMKEPEAVKEPIETAKQPAPEVQEPESKPQPQPQPRTRKHPPENKAVNTAPENK